MKPKIISALYRKANSTLCKFRLKTGMYTKRRLPEYDFGCLQKHWPYVDPECVRDDYHRPTADGVDLSICVPMYNAASFIENLLKVIDRQKTEYSFEVVLVDDGSKDQTAEIVSRYIAGKKHFVLLRQENGGAAVARNTALDHARGEYVSFVDSDDLISDDYIQALMSCAKANDADIVKGNYCIQRGNQIIPMGSASNLICGGVIRASLLDRVRFPAGYWHEDMINLFLITPQAKKIAAIDKVVLYYNDTAGSASKVTAGTKNYRALQQLYLVISLTAYVVLISLANLLLAALVLILYALVAG